MKMSECVPDCVSVPALELNPPLNGIFIIVFHCKHVFKLFSDMLEIDQS